MQLFTYIYNNTPNAPILNILYLQNHFTLLVLSPKIYKFYYQKFIKFANVWYNLLVVELDFKILDIWWTCCEIQLHIEVYKMEHEWLSHNWDITFWRCDCSLGGNASKHVCIPFISWTPYLFKWTFNSQDMCITCLQGLP